MAIKKKIVIGLLSCQAAGHRREWCRELWTRRARDYPALDVFFSIGTMALTAPVRCDDLLLLPCEDSYRTLPQKTRGMVKWALANVDCDYFFKADDDTYVDLDRIVAYATAGRDYIGAGISAAGQNKTPYAHGGSGYFLSRRAMEIVAARMDVPCGDEDKAVGTLLIDSGMPLAHEKRLVAEFMRDKFPGVGNETISMHRVRTPVEYGYARSVVLATQELR